MPRDRARLNGWQRLWIAAAILALVPAALVILADWESAEAWLREAGTAPPTRVEIAGVGQVDFPASMSREAIELVTSASAGDRAALTAGTLAWSAELERLLQPYAAAMNRALVLRVLGWWALGVALLYVVGWLAGWVWRGFRA